MKRIHLPVTTRQHSLSINESSFSETLVPSLDKGSMIQTHYLIRSGAPSVLSFSIDMAEVPDSWKLNFVRDRENLSLPREQFPYGMSERSWWQYALAPHSYLELGSHSCQIGINFFNRFLHLDLNEKSAYLVDPEIGDELLSTTNRYDQASDELWFASWPVRDTVRRLLNPGATTRAAVWKLSLRDEKLEQIWQGDLGDSLHQLSISPDRRFLILTELGLRTHEKIPIRSVDESPDEWEGLRKKGLVPSEILVFDLKTNKEWHLPMVTAGHIEFDPEYPDVCYLSGHNIGLIGVKVGIFGPGSIQKFRLTGEGPVFLGEYTDPHFHRITTHTVFKHKERTLIAVSGYPGTLFLIDADTMTLYKKMEKERGENVDASRLPHLCRQDSYGISPSTDGESIMIAGTGFVQVANIAEGKYFAKERIGEYGENSCFTGHLGTKEFSRRSEI